MSDELGKGWLAIQQRLDQVYPNVEPTHFGTVQRYSEGGPDPLDGISVYQNNDHWHYVTFGFSELDAKESDNAEVSGWGLELSFRLARPDHETKPQAWPIPFLQMLARYVFNQSAPFDHGHYISWGGPITPEPDTELCALLFMADEQLEIIDTPNGRVKMLAVIPLLNPEYETICEQGPEALLKALNDKNDYLITDLQRSSPIVG